jgi:tetratricopeptide (TPR) repeat protein
MGGKPVVCALVIAVAASSLASEGDTREQARTHFRVGTVFYEGHAYDAAIREYEIAYRLSPLPDLLFNLGQAHRMKGDYKQAAELYKRYLDARPTGPTADQARELLAEVEAALDASPSQHVPPPTADSNRSAPASISGPTSEPAAALVQTPPPARSRKSRRWIWGAAIGGVAVAGVALGIGLGVGMQAHAPRADAQVGF